MPMKHSQSSQGNRLTRPSPLIYFSAIITMQEFQPFLGDPIPCGPWPEKSFRLFRHLITTIILGFFSYYKFKTKTISSFPLREINQIALSAPYIIMTIVLPRSQISCWFLQFLSTMLARITQLLNGIITTQGSPKSRFCF